jgi:hypothetical protein
MSLPAVGKFTGMFFDQIGFTGRSRHLLFVTDAIDRFRKDRHSAIQARRPAHAWILSLATGAGLVSANILADGDMKDHSQV